METIKTLNKLTNEELAPVMFSSFQGRTKELVECLELPDIRGEVGLSRMWPI